MFHDIEQNTDEWLDMRIGKLTGSGCSKIMANYGKAFGEPAKKLAVRIALEQITGKRSQAEQFTNAYMENGHIQEPFARALYEDTYFVDVTNGGFFDCGDTGCSPDGCVNDNGLIEIKSVIDWVHRNNRKRGGIDPSYKWQVYFNLNETQKEWLDFISYCVDFPANSQLYVHRVHAEDSQDYFKMIESRKAEFFEMVEAEKRAILGD